jgi:molybdate transport repressor ModE-like protein/molybdopterin-binding protein
MFNDSEIRMKIKPAFKMWFESDGSHLFGQGTIELLKQILEKGNLVDATKTMKISYRHAWGLIKEAEKRIGEPLVETHKGGEFGGGGTKLTKKSLNLIRQYSRIDNVVKEIIEDQNIWEGLFIKISARNKIKGEVISVNKGPVAASVKIKVQVPSIITALITREAVEDLNIQEGDQVAAVVKSTEVMVSKEK